MTTAELLEAAKNFDPKSDLPNYFVINKSNKSIYYEAIDTYDAHRNCPPNCTVICVRDSKLDKFLSEYSAF
jgi:hypothetical protein